MRDNVLFYEEIYTAGKKITLLQVVPVVTNLTSVNKKDAKIINSVFFKFAGLKNSKSYIKHFFIVGNSHLYFSFVS